MDILDTLLSRRTVKDFLPKFISWENISRILDAGRHAPSSGNLQNWKFVLVYEPNQKQMLAECTYEQLEIVSAHTLIIVCGEPEKAERYYGAKGKQFTTQNCAAAVENMLLEAHSLGLGTRWIGAFDEAAVKVLLDVPEEATVEAIVAVGYAKDVPSKPSKYPLETLVYFGKWRRKMRDPAKYMNDVAAILQRKAKAAKESLQYAVSSFTEKLRPEDSRSGGK